jgi:hypothetical protein
VGDVLLAADRWPSNGHLIADVARLGYLDGHVLDASYGLGVFWQQWRPDRFTGHDLEADKAPDGALDVRHLPDRYPRSTFDSAVWDPPYKMRGTPASGSTDERYGIGQPATVDEIVELILAGMTACAAVLTRRGHLLVKMQDQVVGGRVFWQTDVTTAHAAELGFDKVDRFDLLGGGRPQPGGRVQQHAYGRPSTLLVFRGRRDRPIGQQALEL